MCVTIHLLTHLLIHLSIALCRVASCQVGLGRVVSCRVVLCRVVSSSVVSHHIVFMIKFQMHMYMHTNTYVHAFCAILTIKCSAHAALDVLTCNDYMHLKCLLAEFDNAHLFFLYELSACTKHAICFSLQHVVLS